MKNPEAKNASGATLATNSDGLLSQTLDRMLEGIQIIGFDWRYLYVNESLARQTNNRKEELIGHTMHEMFPGIEHSPLFLVLSECMDQRTTRVMENIFPFPDGRTGWFELSIQPVPEGLLVLSIDTTARKLAELKQHASEQENRSLIDQASDGIFIFDDQGNYFDVNQAACDMLGYTREEFLMLNVRNLLPDDAKDVSLRFGDLVAGKTILTTRDLRKKDGTTIPVETHAKVLANGKILGVARDITERRAAQKKLEVLNEELDQKVIERTAQLEKKVNQLRESEEKFQKAFQASAAGIAITRLSDSTYLEVNDTFSLMTGYSREELVGRTSAELGLIVNMERREEILQRVREQGYAKDFEMSVRHRSGKVADVLSSVETILLNDEDYAINIIFDITGRKKAEAQLEALNNELEAFSYSVSHDLRAPLRSIIGYARILEEDFADKGGEEGKKSLGIIQHNAARMNALIDDLLQFSRLGKQEMQRMMIDTEGLVAEIIKEFSGNSPHHASILVGALPPTYADKALLNQVWINLISNAIKYSSKKENARIEIGSTKTGNETIYFVRDNGAGFNMEYAGKLFGVFQRLHKPADFPGTGVGLSIVKRIVGRHDGRIWADAKVNEGATFFFTIPA